MNLEQAEAKFCELLRQIDPAHLPKFILWIQQTYLMATCSGQEVAEANHKMMQIASYLKTIVPGNAVLPSENITVPTKGESAGSDCGTTVYMDAFLYDDYEVDDLIKEGKLSRNYCKACGSRNIAPITFISHSATARTAEFIFRVMLPSLKDKSVLDVGSRLGVMLYAAHEFTPANSITGVEMNTDLCKIQETTIKHFKMDDRVKVVNANVLKVPNLVSSSDVVILNNVFEFFMPEPDQVALWQFLRRTVKKGAILVTVPSLEDSLKQLKTGIVVSKWVKKCPVAQDTWRYCYVLNGEDRSEVFCYEVL